MEEELISFGTAKLAKEKGCDIKGNCIYIGDKDVDLIQNYGTINKDYWQAPTQSLLQKWLREEHNLRVEVQSLIDSTYAYSIYQVLQNNSYCKEIIFKQTESCIYKEALEVGLKHALKLI
jgi:hypothetical protein